MNKPKPLNLNNSSDKSENFFSNFQKLKINTELQKPTPVESNLLDISSLLLKAKTVSSNSSKENKISELLSTKQENPTNLLKIVESNKEVKKNEIPNVTASNTISNNNKDNLVNAFLSTKTSNIKSESQMKVIPTTSPAKQVNNNSPSPIKPNSISSLRPLSPVKPAIVKALTPNKVNSPKDANKKSTNFLNLLNQFKSPPSSKSNTKTLSDSPKLFETPISTTFRENTTPALVKVPPPSPDCRNVLNLEEIKNMYDSNLVISTNDLNRIPSYNTLIVPPTTPIDENSHEFDYYIQSQHSIPDGSIRLHGLKGNHIFNGELESLEPLNSLLEINNKGLDNNNNRKESVDEQKRSDYVIEDIAEREDTLPSDVNNDESTVIKEKEDITEKKVVLLSDNNDEVSQITQKNNETTFKDQEETDLINLLGKEKEGSIELDGPGDVLEDDGNEWGGWE